MKAIVFTIFLLLSLNAYSQEIDSTRIKTSLSLQARDWLFLNSFIKNSQAFENVYDSFKVKLRATTQPTLTTVIRVDSIRQGQIVNLARVLKEAQYSVVAFAYARLNTALKAVNAYTARKIDEMDTEYSNRYDARLLAEYADLRSVLTQ